MSLPQPTPGLVICYSYLWHSEMLNGETEGRKNRPCVVLIAKTALGEDTKVLVAPITHTKPPHNHAIEIPKKVKRHIGMDNEPSWIITNDLNEFAWPHGLQRVSKNSKQFSWGTLPSDLFEKVRQMVVSNREAALKVKRD